MAQARLLSKALRVRRILRRLAKAKENSIRAMVGLPPVMSWYEQCCGGISSAIRECLCKAFCPCCIDVPSFGEFCCRKGSFGFKLCTDGFYPNDIMKSVFGFFFGLLLSTGIFFFMCLQLETNYEFALTASTILGLVLSIGMAFFGAVRCLVFLSLPNFCSSKGRSFLVMYAMVLVLNHPVQNFSHNMTVLTDAATCGQSLALNETKKLAEAAASPLLSIIAGIKEMLSSIWRFANDLRNAFKALVRAVKEIVAVIARVFSWLASMVDVCNENMGQPYRKCKKVFEDGYDKCSDALSIFDFLCSVVTLVGKVCYLARIGELLCVIAGVVKDLVISKVGPPVMARISDVKEMFYFNVSITYHFKYNMNQSRPYSEVRDAILDEIKDKLSVIDVVQAIIDNVMSLTILLVVVKALLYRRGYLNKDNYDNVYITRHLYEIDARRTEMEKEVIFPLKTMETLKYIPTFSWKLTKKEATKMAKGILFWMFAAFHAAYYMICDFGLYWILDLVRRHMDVRTSAAIPAHLQMHVQGEGPMADMYKAMVGVVEPASDDGLDIDTRQCLPNPCVPNYSAYKTVSGILGICFFLTLFEAYGLRLRHIVAACYYPHRERIRAIWLYNHILVSRGGFLVFARRQIHRKFKNEKSIEKSSIISRMVAQFRLCKILMKILGRERKHCLSCGVEGKKSDVDNFVHCDNCKSPYCLDCFASLGNICTACMNPVDYGDADDESVETDSSEDEEDKATRVRNLKARKQKVVKKQQEKRPDQVMQAFQTRFAVPRTPSEIALMAKEKSSSDEDGDSSDVGEESTSQYDTDYQYRTASTSEQSEEEEKARRRSTLSKKRSEMVTLDIFNKDNEN